MDPLNSAFLPLKSFINTHLPFQTKIVISKHQARSVWKHLKTFFVRETFVINIILVGLINLYTSVRNPDFSIYGNALLYHLKKGEASIKRANSMNDYIVVFLKCL